MATERESLNAGEHPDNALPRRELDALGDRLAECERELSLVYAVDEKVHGAGRSHAVLAELIGRSGRFLSIACSVLLMPSKRIRISATHSSWQNVDQRLVDRYLIEQILPQLQGRRSPLVFEIPAIEGAGHGGEQGHHQTLASPLLGANGDVEGVLAQLGHVNREPFDKVHRRFMAHIVRKVAYVIEQSFDAMTGLMNRSGFEAQLTESYEELAGSNDSHQLLYMDIDKLQLVNDTFGRAAGDAVILRFARLVENHLPKSAVLSRLAGNDFCMLLLRADAEAALALAQTIRRESRSLRYLEGDKSLQVTTSIGIAECSRMQGDEVRALINARMACDAAKDRGRDRVEIFDAADHSLIRRQDDMQLVGQIQQTLDTDRFELVAQPVAALSSMPARPRFEVLLRMKDGDGSRVSTASLFSAAERYQLMPQIDRWVIAAAMAQLARCREIVEAAGAVFSINLSGQSLSDDDILEFIDGELDAARLDPRCVGFEVTESAAVAKLARAQALIDALHERGCTISLDDFGVGLSSFAYLKAFRVDVLKIDGSFVRDIVENRISESMVAAITQVAKVMKLQTVAEYVESDASLKLLTEIGVDYAQGYLIGKPVSLEQALGRLTVAAH